MTRNDSEYSEDELLEVTMFYATKYGSYTSDLDRGHLKVPEDRAVQWTFFSYLMFEGIKDDVCRVSLTKVFEEISEEFDFGMKTSHARVLANILLNNLCKASTPSLSNYQIQLDLELLLCLILQKSHCHGQGQLFQIHEVS